MPLRSPDRNFDNFSFSDSTGWPANTGAKPPRPDGPWQGKQFWAIGGVSEATDLLVLSVLVSAAFALLSGALNPGECGL